MLYPQYAIACRSAPAILACTTMSPAIQPVIGYVAHASWDEAARAAVLEIQLAGRQERFRGVVHSGLDPASGTFIHAAQLRKALPGLVGMSVYDVSGKLDPARVTADALRSLRISVSLGARPRVCVRATGGAEPDANTFLRSILR